MLRTAKNPANALVDFRWHPSEFFTSFRMTSGSCQRTLRLRGILFIIGREKALVNERRQDRDHGDHKEGRHSIKLREARKIVEKKFEEGHSEQPQRGVTGRSG